MAEVPDYLLERSREAYFEVKGKYRSDDPDGEAPAPASEDPATPEPEAEPAPSAPAAEEAPVPAETSSAIPDHLIESAKAAIGDSGGGTSAPAPAAPVVPSVPAAPAPTAVAAATPPARTQRLLAVVKSGSIQTTKKDPVDKVNTWPHLLVGEFVALLVVSAFLIGFSVLLNAPLQEQANANLTPNPSKAPWYFLGLQELLTVFHPMVAGVTIPGIGIFGLIVVPYIDRNPSTKPSERKFAIAVFTFFMAYWAILSMLGMFFRGPGFNFVFPWAEGIFFDF